MNMVDENVDGALARLVQAGRLTSEQADAVRLEVDAPPPTGSGPRATGRVLAEIGGYVGGCLVVAGIAVFTGSHWEGLATWAQALIFAGPALLVTATALVVLRLAGDSPVGVRLAAAQLLLAGGLLGGLASVLLPDRFGDGWTWTLIWAVAASAWAAGYWRLRGVLLHLATLSGLLGTVVAAVDQLTNQDWDEVHNWLDLSVGGAMLAVAAAWAVLAGLRVLRERALGLTAAGAVAYVAASYLSTSWSNEHAWPGYLATGLVAGLSLAGYLRTRITGLLVVGVVALATVIPEAVIDYTGGALSTAGALLVAGLSIVAASALGFRLRHQVSTRDEEVSGA